MRKSFIILVSLVITTMNINCYGEIDTDKIERGKLKAKTNKELIIEKSINLGIGSTILKLLNFAQIIFVSEISRRKVTY